MKKTMTVNLNGIVFHIDEDAYQTLNQYLEDLGRHFKAEERDEILRDIEARIAELFTEKLVDRHVVEMADVQDVMKTMGQPNQFEDDSADEARTASQAQCTPRKETKRKLYRDIDNKRIGGVAAGIAAYMDWDVTLVRILMILLLLLSIGWGLFIYILMWIFVPEARSVAQRLEMQGVDPTVDNIKEYGEHRNNVPSGGNSMFAKLLKVVGIVILCCIALGLFFAVIGCIIGLILLLCNVLPVDCSAAMVGFLSSLTLFMLCPAIAVVMFSAYVLTSHRPRHRGFGWVLLTVWVLSIIGLSVTGAMLFKERAAIAQQVKSRYDVCDEVGDAFVSRSVESTAPVYGIVAEGGVRISYTMGDSLSVQVKAPKDMEKGVTTRVRNGVLHIENENRSNLRGTIWVEVTAPQLRSLVMKEACEFTSNAPWRGGNLSVELEEASSVTLSGTIDSLNVKAEEASSANLSELNADVAHVRAEEASTVKLGKNRELRIHSTEASKVTYKGQPERLQSSSSSSFMTRFSD